MSEKVKKGLKIASNVFWGIIWTIFGLLVVLVLWLAIDKFILKNPVPSVFGYSCLTIATGSMNGTSVMVDGGEPVQVNIGDMIIIKDTGDYKIGDVITFLQDGDTIPTTHRIIGYTDDGFITKGDANNVKDTVPVARENVIGEVVGHYPKLGKLTGWIKSEGWIYIVCGLTILALGGVAIKIERDNHKNDDTYDDEPIENDELGVTESDENEESIETEPLESKESLEIEYHEDEPIENGDSFDVEIESSDNESKDENQLENNE